MIRVECDTCHEPLVRDEGGWFGVDYQAPPVADADGGTFVVELGTDHEFHFCSSEHLVAWGYARCLSEEESTP